MEMFTSFLSWCVQKHNSKMNIEDVIIGDDTFALIMLDHVHFLKQKGLLQTIVTNLSVERALCISH